MIPSTFPNQIELPVQWGEMDAFRHVNNVVYFRWFESARVAHLQKLRGGSIRLDEPGPVLGRIDCRYRYRSRIPTRSLRPPAS